MTLKQRLFKFLFTTIWGWKVVGNYPSKEKKFIITVAPHTSVWDFPVGIMFRNWYGADIKFVIKASFFKNPVVGAVTKWLGGIPVNRTKANNFVSAVAQIFNERESLIICITPEGTRQKVQKFKSGFYYIAKRADVPVLPIIFNFGKKELQIEELMYMGDDAEVEIARLQDVYREALGKRPENSFT